LEAAAQALRDGLQPTTQSRRVIPPGFGEGASTSRSKARRVIEMADIASYKDYDDMIAAFRETSENTRLRDFLQTFNFDTTDGRNRQINDDRMLARLRARFAQENANNNNERAEVLLNMIEKHNGVSLSDDFKLAAIELIASILANNRYEQKVTHSKYEQLVTRMSDLRDVDPARYRQVLAKYGVPYTSDVEQASSGILDRQ
jgi:hypothetical protein